MTTTDILGYAKTSDGQYWTIFANGLTDGTTLANINFFDLSGTAKTISQLLKGKIVVEIALQCSDGSILQKVTAKDPQGGVILDIVGCERTSNQRYNWHGKNLKLKVEEGTLFQGYTTD